MKYSLLCEISRRKTVILATLDDLGIKPEDGWVLTPETPDRHGIFITHPDLPDPAVVILSGDGKGNLYLSHGASPLLVTTAWEIAQSMGATL
jgi:hypothetical protein